MHEKSPLSYQFTFIPLGFRWFCRPLSSPKHSSAIALVLAPHCLDTIPNTGRGVRFDPTKKVPSTHVT